MLESVSRGLNNVYYLMWSALYGENAIRGLTNGHYLIDVSGILCTVTEENVSHNE